MALLELFAADRATTTVSSGGTDAPASGTGETWTVASSAMFGAAATGVSQFHVADPVAPTEMIAVTNVSGTTWTVTRGAESTTPVTHIAGFTICQVATAGWLGGLAQLASPVFTGTPAAPTASPLTDGTQVATTAYADAAVAVETSRAETAEALKAPLASPALTGSPTAPTKPALTSNADIATTAYADSAVAVETSRAETAEALLAPKASPVLTGTPTAPTATALTDSTQVATTAYADSAVAVETSRAETAEALALPLAGGTMSGAIAMGSHKVTGLTNGSASSDAAAFGQIPAALPPSGSASGDLGGSYPSPTVTATHLASALPVNQGGTGSTSRNFAGLLTPTAVKTSAYGASAGDYVPCDTTSAGFTVTLPNAPADLTVAGVKMVIQGSTNTVTIAAAGSDVFNKASGGTSLTLTLLNQGVLLQYKASGAIWYVLSDDLALSTLDSRYVASVAAGDTSVVVGGTASAPTIETGTLDVIAADHPPAANWSNNSHKITSLANGSGAQDAAAYGQTPAGGNTVTIGQGGTGQVTQQAAINALTGTQSAGKVLRSDGTNATLAAIQAGDVPTLNQNTTGTAAGLSATLAIGSGGTGQTTAAAAYNALSPMTTTGDLEYESGASTAARLAGPTSATKQFLTSTGTGSAAQAPAWGAIAAGDLPTGTTSAKGALQLDGTAGDIAAVGTSAGAGSTGKAADAGHVHTGVQLAGDLGNTNASPQVVSTHLSSALPVNQGGTGDVSLTAYAVVAGGTTSTGAVQQVSGLGTSGQVLTSNGASALPTWQAGGGGGGGTSLGLVYATAHNYAGP